MGIDVNKSDGLTAASSHTHGFPHSGGKLVSSLSNSITTRVKATYVQLGRSSGLSHCHTAFPSLADSDSVCVATWSGLTAAGLLRILT